MPPAVIIPTSEYYIHSCFESHSVMSDCWQFHGLYPARSLCPWNSPGKNTGMGCHSLLQGIFLTQGLNPGLLHCRQMFFSAEATREAHYILRAAMNTVTLSEPKLKPSVPPQASILLRDNSQHLVNLLKLANSRLGFSLYTMSCYLACWLFSHLEKVSMALLWYVCGLP